MRHNIYIKDKFEEKWACSGRSTWINRMLATLDDGGFEGYARTMPYKDPAKQREFQRDWVRAHASQFKERVFDLLGRECKKCGYHDNTDALEVDHIKPTGTRSSGEKGRFLYRDIARGRVGLDNLQILCANCHAIKTKIDVRKLAEARWSTAQPGKGVDPVLPVKRLSEDDDSSILSLGTRLRTVSHETPISLCPNGHVTNENDRCLVKGCEWNILRKN